jgi:hypothetical protein
MPAQLPQGVDLEVRIQNLYPEYYLDVEINGGLHVLFHNADASRTLGREDISPKDPAQITARLVAGIPLEVLQPGRNSLVVRLHTLGGVKAFPSRIERLAVYYRRGGS